MAKDAGKKKDLFFISRKAQFRVTHLVGDMLRISDSRIAALRKGYIEGQSQGRTELQVNLYY